MQNPGLLHRISHNAKAAEKNLGSFFHGGISMCRKGELHRCCLFCFGLGILFGRWVESWFLCGCVAVFCFSIPLTRRRV